MKSLITITNILLSLLAYLEPLIRNNAPSEAYSSFTKLEILLLILENSSYNQED